MQLALTERIYKQIICDQRKSLPWNLIIAHRNRTEQNARVYQRKLSVYICARVKIALFCKQDAEAQSYVLDKDWDEGMHARTNRQSQEVKQKRSVKRIETWKRIVEHTRKQIKEYTGNGYFNVRSAYLETHT